MVDKYEHINAAVGFAELVRTTLGPRGMNKMIMGKTTILTNDGATILNAIKGGNPIIELFKNLAKSQELEVGDGTTTATLISGQLLSNALFLIQKGLHPTTIISGYNIANQNALGFLDRMKENPDKEKIIKTCFGTKLGGTLVDKLTTELLKVKNYDNLRFFNMDNSNPLESRHYNGLVFKGHTLNERMKSEVSGRIAVLDFPTNVQMDKFNATTAKDLAEVTDASTKIKKDIVDKLIENDVRCVFYTDTNVEIESFLTDAGITGIVIFERDNLDWICKTTMANACSSINQIDSNHLGDGKMHYEKQKIGNRGTIYLKGIGAVETFILNGSTSQVLEEMDRSIHDVVSLLKGNLDCVVGAGAIEIELANYLMNLAKQVGGKEQLAIEKFAEAIESIPLIIAENCGLDAIEILTNLKTLHMKGKKDMGVDLVGISDARERGILEPVLVKIHAVNSATNVATLILKLDQILQGEEK